MLEKGRALLFSFNVPFATSHRDVMPSANMDMFFYRYNALVIVVAEVGYNLSVEQLSGRGYDAPSLLVYRGALGVALIWVLALRSNVNIWPKAPQTQFLRFINSGIVLLLAFEAFHRVAGVTVSVVQRLDIPFAVLLGVAGGQRPRDGKFFLSLLAVAFVLSSFFFVDKMQEDPVGLGLALLAVALTAFAYVLGKISVGVENNLTILNVSSLGCLAVGLVVCAQRKSIHSLDWHDAWLFAGLIVTQFVLNYTMMVLFRHQDIPRAQRPYLLTSILILGADMFLTHKWFPVLHIGFVLLIVSIVYLITLKSPSQTWLLLREKFKGLSKG